MEHKAMIADIRRTIKRDLPRVRVTMGKGTAWGWIDIWGGGEGGWFTSAERAWLKGKGICAGGNCAVISPDEVATWHQRLCA